MCCFFVFMAFFFKGEKSDDRIDRAWPAKAQRERGERMLQEERERHTQSLVRRRSWSPYPWTISDSLWKASWLSPPTNPGSINAHWPCGSARTDREGERVKGCACVSLFVCCTCAWAGKLCGEGKGAAVLMWMSGSLLLQPQLSNLLTAALYKSSQKSYFQQTHKIKEQWYTQKKKTIENVKLNPKLNWLNSLVGLPSQLQRTHCTEREHVWLQEVISVQLRLPRGWHRCADRKTQRNTLSEHTVPQQSRQLWDFQLDAFRVSAARLKTWYY